MLFPLLVASLALSQSGEAGRSVAVIAAGDRAASAAVERHVRAALLAAEVPVSPAPTVSGQDPAQCETNRLCFSLLGRVRGTFAVLRLEAALIGSDAAVLIEALESASGRVIGEASFVVAVANLDAELPLRAAAIAATVRSALPPPRPIVLTPETPPPAITPPALQLAQPPPPRSSAPIWATGAGSVIFAGASAGLFAIGASARSCLHGAPVDGRPTVCVPSSQAAGVQQRADLGFATGAVAAAVAVGLATTAIVQYLSSN